MHSSCLFVFCCDFHVSFVQPAVQGLFDTMTAYFHLKGECERQKELATAAQSECF